MSEKSTWTWFLFLPDDPLQEPRIVFDGYIAPESGTIIEVVNAERIAELEAELNHQTLMLEESRAEIERLRDLIELMQSAVQDYLPPNPQYADKDWLVNRLIYLLDGPEQRAAMEGE